AQGLVVILPPLVGAERVCRRHRSPATQVIDVLFAFADKHGLRRIGVQQFGQAVKQMWNTLQVPYPASFAVRSSLLEVFRVGEPNGLELQTTGLIDVIVDGGDVLQPQQPPYLLHHGLTVGAEQSDQLRPAACRLIRLQSRRSVRNKSNALVGFFVLRRLRQGFNEGLGGGDRQASPKQTADQGTITVLALVSLTQAVPGADKDIDHGGDLLGRKGAPGMLGIGGGSHQSCSSPVSPPSSSRRSSLLKQG